LAVIETAAELPNPGQDHFGDHGLDMKEQERTQEYGEGRQEHEER
jgi:hypothetical protein